MFSPDALKALLAGTLSDMELSSDDEEPFRFTSERELQSVRVGADVINQNQREVFPHDSDEDEGPSSTWIGTNDPGVTDTCDEVVLEVPPTTEIESSHENILQNITPKQNIKWRHRELLNTISSDWFPPISIDPTVEAPVDYYFRYVPKQLFENMAEMTNIYAIHSNKPRYKPTTTQEIEILFGLHLATGIFSYPCLKMYWETGISIPLFSENMARDRFFELRNTLHLVDSPVADIARDGVGHFPAHDEGLGTRCKMVGCKGRTRIKCIKCKVHLCLTKDKNCFLAFHK